MNELVSLLPRGDLLFMLVLAALLGGAIGLERELSGKPAGFRTNLLICVGAALLTDLSVLIGGMAANPANADPGRIAAQIVSGIGFLGAGTIIQARGSVVGLTTAATLWVVSAIGIAVGARQYTEAIGTTLLVLLALLVLGKVETHLIHAKRAQNMVVQTAPDIELVLAVEQILDRHDLGHRMIELERREGEFVFAFELRGATARRGVAMLEVAALEGVRKVRQAE
ncbi:MAG TPA: MgtC/SapB family protein [Longimicrobiales bacterium]|nr:MgtC/SapB family protein [Longimicrobiales bacterium]